jgi:hypothetical protein
MNDEKTRRIGSSPSDDHTRIISPRTGEETVIVGSDVPKTKLVRRPSAPKDPEAARGAAPADDDEADQFVVGWLVVTGGPGRGKFSAIFDGMNTVGRGPDQSTQLDFGDETISRSSHAFITYDNLARKFYIQHGGKSNLVRVNKAPVLQPTELNRGDEISLGNTVLRFVPFCGESFDWQDK